MATRAEVAAYRAAQRDVTTLAVDALAGLWATLEHGDAAAVSAAMVEFFPDLVQTYGETAALVAVDQYDALRLAAEAAGSYGAVMGDTIGADQAAAVARWGVGPLFSADPNADQALAFLAGGLQRLVQQAARNTIGWNTSRDPAKPRWARVPHSKTCAFCLMLASRGAVYWDARAAGGDMNRYHGHCDCTPTPVWGGQELPYDADALYDDYRTAREAADSSDPAKILAQLRVDQGIA